MNDTSVLTHSPVVAATWHEEGGARSEAYTVSEFGIGWRRERWFSNPHGAQSWLERAAGVPCVRAGEIAVLELVPDVEGPRNTYLRAGAGASGGLMEELGALLRAARGSGSDARTRRSHAEDRDRLLAGWACWSSPGALDLARFGGRVELDPFTDRVEISVAGSLPLVWAGSRAWACTGTAPICEAFQAAGTAADQAASGTGDVTAWHATFEEELARTGFVAVGDGVLRAIAGTKGPG